MIYAIKSQQAKWVMARYFEARTEHRRSRHVAAATEQSLFCRRSSKAFRRWDTAKFENWGRRI
jgi:hypothetical protein